LPIDAIVAKSGRLCGLTHDGRFYLVYTISPVLECHETLTNGTFILRCRRGWVLASCVSQTSTTHDGKYPPQIARRPRTAILSPHYLARIFARTKPLPLTVVVKSDSISMVADWLPEEYHVRRYPAKAITRCVAKAVWAAMTQDEQAQLTAADLPPHMIMLVRPGRVSKVVNFGSAVVSTWGEGKATAVELDNGQWATLAGSAEIVYYDSVRWLRKDWPGRVPRPKPWRQCC
jgi:hypothetical protein